VALGVVACVAIGVVGTPVQAGAAPAGVPVQVLAINDLHGRLTLPGGSEGRLVTGPGPDGVYGTSDTGVSDDVVVRVGGAFNVAATVGRLQGEFARQAGASAASFFVASGDLFGSSPPVSADYRDEPTIEMVNALGLDVSAVGDDELAIGTRELRRISSATDGQYTDDVTACQVPRPGVDGCFGDGEHAFTGAQFPYLAANVVSRATGEPMLPPYQVFATPEGLQVGFIGVVGQGAAENVPPEAIADVEILDEAETVNRWAGELERQGVRAVGVLLHEGGGEKGLGTSADTTGCDRLTGPVTRINGLIDPAVDFIMGGHRHSSINCLLPSPQGEPRLVTQAGAYGRMATDIRLTLDPATGEVDRRATYSAVNVPALRSASPDPRLQAILDYWSAGPGNQSTDAATGARADGRARTDQPTGGSGGPELVRVALLASIGLVVILAGSAFVRYRRRRLR
jgi:5'-nucleotidase